MRTRDVLGAVLIIMVFLLMYAFSIAIVQTSAIRKNWGVYRCNPAYMPFSKSIAGIEPEDNMKYCMTNSSGGIMKAALEPINDSIGVVNVLISTIVSTISDLQGYVVGITDTSSGTFGGLFDSIGGITGIFSGITDNLIDAISRTSAIASVLQYTAQGVALTAESLDNAVCFHPETLLTLKDNTEKSIQDIELGDELVNGSRVEGIVKLTNVDSKGNIKEKFYKIQGKTRAIFVTGEHLVLDKDKGKYVKVKDYHKSMLTDKSTDIVICLITSDHKIVIDNEIFWDWEDEWFYK